MGTVISYVSQGSSLLQPKVQEKYHRPGQKGIFNIQSLESAVRSNLLETGVSTRINCFEMIWVKSGSGLLRIDTATHMIGDNLIYCMVPGQMRHCIFTGDVDGYYLSFSEDFLFKTAAFANGTCWMDPYLSGACIIAADNTMLNETEDIISKMISEYNQYNLLRSEILSGLLYLLIMYCTRKLPAKTEETPASKDTQLVQRFLQLVKAQFSKMKLVSDYAAELCVTANYLNRTVKKITGTTASAHIQRHIITEAKRQAVHSNLSMKEIAYQLGFDDLAHFSKYFKNNSGMSFTSFKREPLAS